MIYNHSFLTLTLESRVLLMDLFQGVPVRCNLDVPVTMMISTDSIPVDYSVKYAARLMPMHFQFDPDDGRKQLILPVLSEELMLRHEKLIQDGVRPAFSPYYFPHLLLNADLPPVRKNYKSILNSLSSAFVEYQHEIVLSEETVVTEEFDGSPVRAYYHDMANAAGLDGE